MEKRENAIPKTMKAWAVTTPGPIDGKKSPIEFTYDRWQKARDFSHGMNAT